MMLLFAPHSAEKFSAPISGLRSLLVVPDADADAGTRGGCVVTRAAVAAAHGCGQREDVTERRDDDDGRASLVGRRAEDVETAKEEGEGEENGSMEVIKEREEEDELDGFWVSYGRRCPRRRLPPPIPSLVARGALRRTRTDDGRLVIRIVPVVRPECIRARRRRDRLVVVEHEDDSPAMPPPPLREPTTTAAREDGVVRINVAQAPDDDNATTPVAGEVVRHVEEDAVAAAPAETLPAAAVPPPRVSSVGCFEEVFKLGSIGSSSLHQMMPSLRMVH
ncbi:hypothetical protein SORBI_3004G234700 [Sorghum bicolor]|uniref:FAF domain-containing protein n=1 Tax=Sorghum bicolor TaxID=4558 RepID=A0A1Z5RPP7_SORBI|nr:hypothetical protein SORBI_3004G234700 [Sorghum bicolor]